MSRMLFALIGTTLLMTFIMCCVFSAVLQILAWSRHAREGVSVSVRALWKPQGYFDEVGLRQIQLARRLLLVGGIAYVLFGSFMIGARVLASL